VVIVKNGQTASVGTGEQDRVGAVEQAIEKFRQKYSGSNGIEGAAMSSDGFFPSRTRSKWPPPPYQAIVAPSGSLRRRGGPARQRAGRRLSTRPSASSRIIEPELFADAFESRS
jgi:hypothetical protein